MRSGAIDWTAAGGNDRALGQGFGPRPSASAPKASAMDESAFAAALRPGEAVKKKECGAARCSLPSS